MSSYRVWVLLALVALASGWAGYRFSQKTKATAEIESADLLSQLRAAPLQGLDGGTHRLDEWRGKIVVVNFWATWCPPCREEMPAFSRIQQEIGIKSVQFVGIAIDNPDQVRQFSRETPVSYPLVIGSAATLGITGALGNAGQGLPFTLILGREGQTLSSKLGRMTDKELRTQLASALAPNP